MNDLPHGLWFHSHCVLDTLEEMSEGGLKARNHKGIPKSYHPQKGESFGLHHSLGGHQDQPILAKGHPSIEASVIAQYTQKSETKEKEIKEKKKRKSSELKKRIFLPVIQYRYDRSKNKEHFSTAQ